MGDGEMSLKRILLEKVIKTKNRYEIIYDSMDDSLSYITLNIARGYTYEAYWGDIIYDIVNHDEKYGVIGYFIVDENAQGRGIGDYLMKEVEKIAKTEQLESILLRVADIDGTGKAISFYEKYGFEVVGEVDNDEIMKKNYVS